MKALLSIGGWILAFVAMAVAVFLGVELWQSRAQLRAAAQEKEVFEAQISSLEQLNEARLKEFEAKLKTAEMSAEPAPAPEGGITPEQKAELASALLNKALSGDDVPEPEKEGGPAEAIKGIAKMLEGGGGEAVAKVTAQGQVDSQYGALLRELNLPADVDEQVRGILAANLESQMQAGIKALASGKIDSEQIGKEQQAARQQLRDDLGKVLSPEELARYDQYVEEMPRNMLAQQYEMQLNLAGTSLSPESRELVTQTLVEETLAVEPNFGRGDAPPNPGAAFNAQIQAMDRARERLSAELTEEEFTQVQRFLTQQQNQLQMVRELTGNLFSGKEQTSSPQ